VLEDVREDVALDQKPANGGSRYRQQPIRNVGKVRGRYF